MSAPEVDYKQLATLARISAGAAQGDYSDTKRKLINFTSGVLSDKLVSEYVTAAIHERDANDRSKKVS